MRIVELISIIVLVLMQTPSVSLAQLRLKFLGIYSYDQQVTGRHSGQCGKKYRYTDTSDILIAVNGKPISHITDVSPTCCGYYSLSTAVVFDQSAGMKNPFLRQAVEWGKAFIDAMDGGSDELELITCAETSSVETFMTNDRDLPKIKLDSFPEGKGRRALWDAIWLGLNELVNNGSQYMRVLIAFIAGTDEGSCRSLGEVINFAIKHRVPIYLLAAGSSLDDPELNMLAHETGGKYFLPPNPSALVGIYAEQTATEARFDYSRSFRFESPLPLDSIRRIDLTLKSLLDCSGAPVTKTKFYSLLKDVTDYRLDLHIEDNTVRGEAKTFIRLHGTSDYDGYLPRGSCKITVDTSLLQFDHMHFANTSFESVRNEPDGYRIFFPRYGYFNEDSLQGIVMFRTRDVDSISSVPLNIGEWQFDDRRFNYTFARTHVQLLPNAPRVACKVMQPPPSIRWDASLKTYSPNPIRASFDFSNCGHRDAINATATVTVDTNIFTLQSPQTNTQRISPSGFHPATSETASWDLFIKPQLRDTISVVSCTFIADNHAPVTCSMEVTIPGTSLTLVTEEPNLKFYLEQNFPNPFSTSTVIKTHIADAHSPISLKVLDLFGREVLDLSKALLDHSEIVVRREQLPATGMYFYRLTSGKEVMTRAMIVR